MVEAELATPAQLWRELSSRDRAREVFARRACGIRKRTTALLIYLLLADHKVEVVADRGVDAKVAPGEWQAICHAMEAHFRGGRFEEEVRSPACARSRTCWRATFPRGGGAQRAGGRPVLM